MSKINKFLAALVLTLLFTASGMIEAHGLGIIIGKNSKIFAVGSDENWWSYLFTIDPLKGTLHLVGDTGFNNCRGLDFTPEGKLKAFCEERQDAAPGNNSLRAVAAGVTLELDTNSGDPLWVVPTGISNAVQDIAIRRDGVLFSHEKSQPSLLYKHLKEDDFQAILLGPSGVEAEYAGLAVWELKDLKIAANTGVPMLYDVDPTSGAATPAGKLIFPGEVVNSVSRLISSRYDQVQIVSMDSIKFQATDEAAPAAPRAEAEPFEETDAEFIVLLALFDDKLTDEKFLNPIGNAQMALALIDMDTMTVGYIKELNTGGMSIVAASDPATEARLISGDIFLEAITIRLNQPRPIPTMSEWAMIAMSCGLGLLGLFAIRRRKLLESKG